MEFRAIWPVVDESPTEDELIQEGLADLPSVALRHHVAITGQPGFRLMPGARVPGSNGADLVLVAQAPCEPLPPRPYWRTGNTP
ncbi:hypothetical protein C6401_10785 [Arthrobacter woluwensis]|nr:hypothetical protein C6401_10785 [Arthrobacter woluwensis]